MFYLKNENNKNDKIIKKLISSDIRIIILLSLYNEHIHGTLLSYF